jgi:hypothetical protein
MEEEQTALANNFGFFINYFLGSGLDYHVGVVSTAWDDAVERGRLREARGYKWIDADTANPADVFRSMAQMGVTGPSDEKGRAQVFGAIELLGERNNAGFYREDAALAVVVISDENDASGRTPIDLNGFIGWLDQLKDDSEKTSFSSIVGPQGGCATAVEGTDYLKVTRAVGGIEFSICERDWSSVLEDLGIQAAGLKREFFLSAVPVDDTLEVWVEVEGERRDFDEGADYVYSRARNSVRFVTYVPDPLSEVFVQYKPLAEDQRSNDDVGR